MMEYKGYYAQVQFDDSISALHGWVVNTRDTITFEATSVKQIAAEFHASVDDYLEWCEEEGVSPQKPYNGTLSLRLPPDLHQQVALRAAEKSISINRYITERLSESLAQ